MNIESTPNQESEIIWTATGERFMGKIDEELSLIESIPGIDIDTNERYQKLESLKKTIEELFVSYERKNFTIKQVQDDLDYRIKNEDDEEKIKEYEQIKLFVNASFNIII